MNCNKLLLLCSIALAFQASAQSPTTNWDSDVVENYLSPNKGNTVEKVTDVDNRSRWYMTARVKGGSEFRTGDEAKSQTNLYMQGNLRIRGKSMIFGDTGFFGDFWLKGIENYTESEGTNTNDFDGFDDTTKWEQFRFGLESDSLGALMFAKHTATWAIYTTDIGVQGLYDTQGDAGGKNTDKLIYKNQFDNNLFLNSSYDFRSEIIGLDIGYQTSDIYSYLPNSYGIYFSIHNGQPMLENGSGSYIIGNADTNGKIDSDSSYRRHYRNLYTYSISGFGQIDVSHRFGASISYSKMDQDETAKKIEQRGYTSGGLGLSGTVSYQYMPTNGVGFAPVFTLSQDEFGSTFAPELDYYFKPYLKVWIAHTLNSSGQDLTRLEFQYDI